MSDSKSRRFLAEVALGIGGAFVVAGVIKLFFTDPETLSSQFNDLDVQDVDKAELTTDNKYACKDGDRIAVVKRKGDGTITVDFNGGASEISSTQTMENEKEFPAAVVKAKAYCAGPTKP